MKEKDIHCRCITKPADDECDYPECEKRLQALLNNEKRYMPPTNKAMSDKTKEEILDSFCVGIAAGQYTIECGKAEQAMQAYADQEKRKEAIAFAEWITEQDWYQNSAEEWIRRGHLAQYISTGELYDLYLQSLPKTV